MDANETFTTPLPNTVGGGLHGQAEGTVCSTGPRNMNSHSHHKSYTNPHTFLTTKSYGHAGSTMSLPKGSQQHMDR